MGKMGVFFILFFLGTRHFYLFFLIAFLDVAKTWYF